MTKHVAPKFNTSAYNCPFCNAYSSIEWKRTYFHDGGNVGTPVYRANCVHCDEPSYWYALSSEEGYMILPSAALGPMPHPDMPTEVASDYLEAREIVAKSPRGAAALLRLSIQKLCKVLGEPGDHIDTDIKSLVSKGLPLEIQRALDIVRVVGNKAVHPGELTEDDIAGVATSLFELVNAIVEDRIARPKALEELYMRLPEGARNAIAKRDER